MKNKLIWVRWVDACFMSDGWRCPDDENLKEAGMMVESGGLLMRDDENGLLIATDYDPDDGTFRHVSFVPRGMIRKKKVFTVDA